MCISTLYAIPVLWKDMAKPGWYFFCVIVHFRYVNNWFAIQNSFFLENRWRSYPYDRDNHIQYNVLCKKQSQQLVYIFHFLSKYNDICTTDIQNKNVWSWKLMEELSVQKGYPLIDSHFSPQRKTGKNCQ